MNHGVSVLRNTHSLAHRWKVEYSFLTIALLIGGVYAYGQSHLEFIAFFSYATTPFEAFAAFAMAIVLFRGHSGRRGGGMSRVFALYSLGMLSWFLAEGTWTIYALVAGIVVPYPSIADVFWLVGYVPLLLALQLQVWPFREAFVPWKRVTIVLSMFILTGLILTVTIPPLFQGNQDLLTLTVSLAYPFLDAVVLSVAIPCLLLFRRGTYWRFALFIVFGLVLALVGDLTFAQSFLSASYYPGSHVDMIFDWSYLALALGFYKGIKPNL